MEYVKENKLQVMQLGNGGGFDFDKTSSSFLIKHEQTLILVDCGFNVMNTLMTVGKRDSIDYIKNIDAVCITHVHEDHIGNLMSLVYYRYFMLNKQTTIIAGTPEIRKTIQNYLEPCTYEYKSGQKIYIGMTIIKSPDIVKNLVIKPTPAFHPGVSATGFMFYPVTKGNTIVISGDTKATFTLEDTVKAHATAYCSKGLNNIKIFHDFSNWDNVSQNVHACASDIASEYSDKFRELLTYYHDNSPFILKWE